MGGTCAVDLTVMHPDLFSSFVDIAGDLGPNAGNKAQTIARLFGGNADAWAAFDPTTVITRHGPYTGVSGWFAISSGDAASSAIAASVTDAGTMRLAGRDADANPSDQTAAADALCALGRANGIDCAVVAQPGKHDWPFASRPSRRRCRGWPAGWALPGCRGSRCRPLRLPRRSRAPRAEPVGR